MSTGWTLRPGGADGGVSVWSVSGGIRLKTLSCESVSRESAGGESAGGESATYESLCADSVQRLRAFMMFSRRLIRVHVSHAARGSQFAYGSGGDNARAMCFSRYAGMSTRCGRGGGAGQALRTTP